MQTHFVNTIKSLLIFGMALMIPTISHASGPWQCDNAPRGTTDAAAEITFNGLNIRVWRLGTGDMTARVSELRTGGTSLASIVPNAITRIAPALMEIEDEVYLVIAGTDGNYWYIRFDQNTRRFDGALVKLSNDGLMQTGITPGGGGFNEPRAAMIVGPTITNEIRAWAIRPRQGHPDLLAVDESWLPVPGSGRTFQTPLVLGVHNRLIVFHRETGSGGHLWHQDFNPHTFTWDGVWRSLDGGGALSLGVSGAVTSTNGQPTFTLVGSGLDNQVWDEIITPTGTVVRAWQPMPTQNGHQIAVIQRPAVSTAPPYRIFITADAEASRVLGCSTASAPLPSR